MRVGQQQRQRGLAVEFKHQIALARGDAAGRTQWLARSEERRVGKEC